MLIDTVEFLNIDDLKNNIAMYAEEFKKTGLLVFRNANLDESDQRRVQEIFGDYFGIYPNSQNIYTQYYVENHEAMEGKDLSGDDIMLGWHMEHLYMSNPIIMGFWNMYNFSADPNTGKTFFYDSRTLYKLIPDDWKDFLALCVIDTSEKMNVLHKVSHTAAIYPHWLTGEPTLRIPLYKNISPLVSFAGSPASDDHKAQYNKIVNNTKLLLLGDTFRTFEHKWQQGDLLIVDIYSMIHAVSGGFDPAAREFRGTWSYPQQFIDS